MLGELMRFRYSVAVAGTHGKTTTTSLVASVLAEGGLDPTFVIGGRLKSADSNARLGAGRYLVAEADESDASFMHLQPMIAIVTNIDNDHLATHAGDFAGLKQSFVDFLHNLPFYGLAVLCIDDPEVRASATPLRGPCVTYGFDEGADVRAVDVRARGPAVALRGAARRLRAARAHDQSAGPPQRAELARGRRGRDRARRSPMPPSSAHSRNFQGIDRRMQQLGEIRWPAGSALLVDDYGHHPTEVAATLEAVRQGWPGRRIVLAFQPHRYSRTRDLLDDFARVLGEADVLLVTEVYAAGEAPIAGADGRAICRAVRGRGRVEPIFVERVEDLADSLRGVLKDGDLVLTMGAGNIGAVAHDLKRPHSGRRRRVTGPCARRTCRRNFARACSATCRWRSTRPGTRAGRPTGCSCRGICMTCPRSCVSCRSRCRSCGWASAATSWCATAASAARSS